ncbi:MAG: rhomboid family intramembrane serine protease [Ignavibacteria bacterium]|nr:rhomboid family intramembrane serine protease [Ignavibacteria bacterium]
MELIESKISVLIFLLFLGFGFFTLFVRPNLRFSLALNPFDFVHNKKLFLLLSHMFVHFDFIHLLFNSLTFLFFAPQVEMTVGSLYFVVLFLSSGIFSSIPSIIKQKDNPNYYSLGASGAISGVVFSFLMFYPTSRIYVFFVPIGIPAPIFGLLFLIYCVYAAKYQSSNINHEAHFWGAIWGIIFTIIIEPKVVLNIIRFIEVFIQGF